MGGGGEAENDNAEVLVKRDVTGESEETADIDDTEDTDAVLDAGVLNTAG